MEIKGNQILELGYPAGKVIGIALELIDNDYKKMDAKVVLDILKKVIDNPSAYLDDKTLSPLAFELLSLLMLLAKASKEAPFDNRL